LYETVHDALIDVLTGCGLSVRRRVGSDASHASRQPFLCFLRHLPGDVLVGTTKVCGSAQRRRRGAILQHGSLLLARSAFAPELPGIEDVAGRALERAEIAARWGEQIARRLALVLSGAELSTAEHDAATRLERQKYACDWWNRRR
jgi:lipoate-protein ligase A